MCFNIKRNVLMEFGMPGGMPLKLYFEQLT